MAFVTKTWKDRLVEFAGRRKLKNVSTGEEILMDVSRSEGTVMQPGDAFSAENMNNLEQRIKTEFDNVNSSLLKMQSGKIVSGCIPHNNNKKFNISFEGFSAIPIILCNAISLGYAGDMTFQGATNVTRNSATIRIDNTFSADINLDGTQRYVEWVAIGI